MADILVTCPGCHGQITCDNAWAGQQVDCPLCNQPLVVPSRAGAGTPVKTNPLMPAPPGGPGKLGIGGGQPSAATPGRNIPIRNLTQSVQKKKNPLVSMLPVLGIVLILAAAGYFGWPYFQEWRAKRAGGEGSGNATAGAPVATNTAPAAPPPATSLPIVPATWTLDIAAARVTDGRASGMLSGTNFVVDTVQAVGAGNAQVLRFIQGQPLSPEREIMIYLKLNLGETVAGQKVSISKEDRPTSVQMLAKRWKGDPRYAPKLQTYAAGYVLKLDLGAETNGIIPGKIFLALPDKEQSVLSGKFDLATVTLSVPGAALGGGMDPAQMELMRRRYLTNRPPAGR